MKKFNMGYSSTESCQCDICHRTGKVLKVEYYTKNYRSERTGKICETLQKHRHSIWICKKCFQDLRAAFEDAREENA